MRKKISFGLARDVGVPIRHAVEAFHLRCKAQNLTAATREWYFWRLKPFAIFFEQKGLNYTSDITPHLVRLYLDRMRERGNCSGTVARDFGALKCFFRFLVGDGLIAENPLALMEKPRMERKLIRPLTIEQVKLLLSHANHKRFTGYRTWTMAVLILDTGLRISEVMGLRKDDSDFGAGVLRVMGKGSKEREVPFGLTSKQALWNYMARRGYVPGQNLVFVNQYGGKTDRRTIGKSFQAIGKRAGITGVRVSPHTLRHTFATQYIVNGGDAFSLQQILGHTTLDMVKIYVGLANRDVALMHQKFSPMDRMGPVPGAKRRVIIR